MHKSNGPVLDIHARRRLAILLSGSAIGILAATAPHAAQLNIPAQDLGAALQKLTLQSGAEIVFSTDMVLGRTSDPVIGDYDTEAALNVLLRSSGVTFEQSGSGRIIIIRAGLKKAAASMQAEPETVPLSRRPEPVLAEAAPETRGLEEVVVTARRKEEKAQSVPITITTFSQSALESQHITDIDQLLRATPGIQSCCGQGTSADAWVRGVNGMQTYFGGAPQILNANPRYLYFDLGSAQLLKGPQGTLFGLASDAGQLVVEPKRPTGNFEGYVEGEVGDYGHRESQFVLNIPIIDDKLLLRVGGQYNHIDGYVKDLASGEDLNDTNYWLGRVQATFRPSDDIENNILVTYESSNTNGNTVLSPGYIYQVNPTGLLAAIGEYTKALAALNRQYQLGPYAIVGYPLPGGESAGYNQWDIINTTTYDLSDNLTFKNILSYSEIDTAPGRSDPGAGFDFLILGSAPNVYSAATGPTVNYSDEFQVLGKAFDDRLSFTLGTFNEWFGTRGPHTVQYSYAFVGVSGSATENDSRTHAVYAQGTYDLSAIVDGLSFTGGYRYNWDTVIGESFSYNGTGTFLLGVSHTVVSKAPDYTMSLDYQLNPQTLFYISDSKGYSKGGVNLGATVPVDLQTFQPESLDTVEVGVKTDNEIFGMKTRANISAYYGFYDNIQAVTAQQVRNADGTFGVISPYENIATAHIEGVESQFTIIPNDQFEFNLSPVWSHATYDKYITPAGVDQSGQNFIYISPWMINAQITYHLPIDQSLGRLSFSAVWDYRSHLYNNNPFPQDRHYITGGFSQVDFSITWADLMGYPGLDARGFLTNVANQAFGTTTNLYNSLGFGTQNILPPREWGVSVRYNFGPR